MEIKWRRWRLVCGETRREVELARQARLVRDLGSNLESLTDREEKAIRQLNRLQVLAVLRLMERMREHCRFQCEDPGPAGKPDQVHAAGGGFWIGNLVRDFLDLWGGQRPEVADDPEEVGDA